MCVYVCMCMFMYMFVSVAGTLGVYDACVCVCMYAGTLGVYMCVRARVCGYYMHAHTYI